MAEKDLKDPQRLMKDLSTLTRSKYCLARHQDTQEGVCWLQGQAEAYLEKLHSMAEKDLKDLQRLMEDPSAATAGAEASRIVSGPDWPHFRQTLIGLTDVTRSHFNKLVEVRLV